MDGERALPQRVRQLIGSAIPTVWALELLLFLKRNGEHVWSVDQLVRELRGSVLLVTENLIQLQRAGLVTAQGTDRYRYLPATPALAGLVDELEKYSAERPFAVRDAILAAPHSRIQLFADAFRMKGE